MQSVGSMAAEDVEETSLAAITAITSGELSLREMQRVRAAALDLARWANENIIKQGGKGFEL